MIWFTVGVKPERATKLVYLSYTARSCISKRLRDCYGAYFAHGEDDNSGVLAMGNSLVVDPRRKDGHYPWR